jgi:hypothetical protein
MQNQPQRARQHQEITKQKLLLGEGKDEVAFFRAILVHLKLEDVQVMEYQGKHGMLAGITAIVKLPGFNEVESIGITRDADYFDNLAATLIPENRSIGEAQAAFDSVCSTLRNAEVNLPIPHAVIHKTTGEKKPSVCVFILPDCIQPGMLEDLCLQSLTGSFNLQCINEYFNCVAQNVNRIHPIHKKSKAMIRAWLACQEEPDLVLGQAAEKGYWNFENPAFDKLKQFILDI